MNKTNPSSRAKTAEVKTAIEAERISAEGKELDSEIKRYNDWGDATKKSENGGSDSHNFSEVKLCGRKYVV